MEIKFFLPLAELSAILIILLSGCIPQPARLETLDDFRRTFAEKRNNSVLPSGNTLTLESAIAISLQNNPTNLAAAQAVTAAKHGYYQALSAYLPEINAGYSVKHTLARGWDLKDPPEGMLRQNNHFITSGSIQASFLLFDGFARELETIIAHQKYQKNIAASRNVRRLLARAVAFAYYDMYLAGEEIIIHNEDLAFQNAALIQEEQRFRGGHVSKASVLNFKILAARAQSNISNAEYRRKTAFHALTALMGCERRQMPGDIKLQKISAEHFEPIYDDEFYLELAVNNRPDLKEEKILLDIAFRNTLKVYSDFLPEIWLLSEFALETYRAKYGHGSDLAAHGNQRSFAYGAEGRWNIFKGFYSVNELQKQKALEKIALWGVNLRFLEIVSEVKDACSNCKNTLRQVQIFQSMAEWVREQRDLVFSEYRNGRETITRLNEAQSLLIEAKSKLVISTIQFNKAAVQLAAVTGTQRLDFSGKTQIKKNSKSSDKEGSSDPDCG